MMRINLKNVAIGFAIVVALASLFALLRVYDSDKMPFAERFVYWAGTIGVGVGSGGFAAPWVINSLLRNRPIALQVTVLSCISSIPVLIVLFALDTGFQRAWPLSRWFSQYWLVLIISLLITFSLYVALKAFGFIESNAGPQGKADEAPIRNFLKRLPIELQDANLYAVSSEDHYLRVHTDRGEELILMRLADAIQELAAAGGIQTHRSWWVARNGIAKVSNNDGKQVLTLKSGAKALVSRSRKKAVREALFYQSE